MEAHKLQCEFDRLMIREYHEFIGLNFEDSIGDVESGIDFSISDVELGEEYERIMKTHCADLKEKSLEQETSGDGISQKCVENCNQKLPNVESDNSVADSNLCSGTVKSLREFRLNKRNHGKKIVPKKFAFNEEASVKGETVSVLTSNLPSSEVDVPRRSIKASLRKLLEAPLSNSK